MSDENIQTPSKARFEALRAKVEARRVLRETEGTASVVPPYTADDMKPVDGSFDDWIANLRKAK